MAEKKFEEAMRQLGEIVQALESDDLPLEDALKDFEKGMELVKFCSEKLEEAERKSLASPGAAAANAGQGVYADV